MRGALCCVVFVSAMMALACGCGTGSGNRPVGKAMTEEEIQAAREKDAQEMLKMKNRSNPGKNETK